MSTPSRDVQAMTPAGLLAARLRDDAASPLITFYDDATGERVELSTATFANWVAKTANLLRDGIGVSEDAVVSIDLPPHWQSLVVAQAAWAMGASVRVGAARTSPPADVAFVTAERAAAAADNDAADVVVLALKPLAMPGDVPAAPWLDYDREVRIHADHFAAPVIDQAAVAIVDPDGTALSHAELAARAGERVARARSATGATRFAWDPNSFDLGHDIDAAVQALASGGGLVLSTGPTPADRLASERAAAWPTTASGR